MNHYSLKIKPIFLNSIRNNTKKHEYRLCTPDRAKVQVGDMLKLVSNQDKNDFVVVLVKRIKNYQNWETVLHENWDEDFKYTFGSYAEALKECFKFYTKEQIDEFGIVQFEIEPLKRKLRNNKVLLDTNIIIHRESHNNVSYNVSHLYKWLDKLKSEKCIHTKTIDEINKYKDEKIRNNMATKLQSYNTFIEHCIDDANFMDVVNKFSKDDNSLVDNEILYQVYEGLVDILITDDRTIINKATYLGIDNIVLSVDEYLKAVEEEFPDKIDYQMLSVKKEKFGNIDINDPFFDTLKEDYPEFLSWFNKKNNEEAYVFKDANGVHGFLYIKIEFEDEQGYYSVNPPLSKKKRLKIGTFKIDDTLKGFRLSERFLKIIFDNAMKNKVEEIYVTLFEGRRKGVDALKKVLCDWGFFKHGYKETKGDSKESVFIKLLDNYDSSKTIKENFPNLPSDRGMYFLPINPEYHTDLFPDAILKSEDANLYSENKGHLYSLEKIYVTNSRGNSAKPGDYIIIYRSGDRYPKKYSSVCTSIAVLEEIKVPETREEYLKTCSNKSVFSEEELINFYDNKNYRTVVKLILYKTLPKKITLDYLQNKGLVDPDSGPRPFTEIPKEFYDIFLSGE